MVHNKLARTETVRLLMAQEKLEKLNDLADQWVINSGATRTMSSKRRWFHSYREFNEPTKVWLGDNTHILTLGAGRISTQMRANGQWNPVIL